ILACRHVETLLPELQDPLEDGVLHSPGGRLDLGPDFCVGESNTVSSFDSWCPNDPFI
ncbi:hypothetical protein OIY81_2337, partial [Cryptosporidium canis]